MTRTPTTLRRRNRICAASLTCLALAACGSETAGAVPGGTSGEDAGVGRSTEKASPSSSSTKSPALVADTSAASSTNASAKLVGGSASFAPASSGQSSQASTSQGNDAGVGDSGSVVVDAAPDAGHARADVDAACVGSYLACTSDGTPCCDGPGTCIKHACGGCFAEGVHCGDPGDAPCCNGLACTNGFCGTNLCSPDGTSCADGSVVCCNDDCNNGTCGG